MTLCDFTTGLSSVSANAQIFGNTTVNTVINAVCVSVGFVGTTVGTFISNNFITIGNSTVNTTANSTHFFSGNSTVYGFSNSTAEGFVNSTSNNISTPGYTTISNSTLYTNTGIGIETFGNSTLNNISNSTALVISSNSTSNLIINAIAITFNSNAAISTNINSLSFFVSNTIGGGYYTLPNGLKVNFGLVVTNSSGANTVTFANAFSQNAYSISLTPIATVYSAIATANTVTKSGFNLLSAVNTGVSNSGILGVYYTSVGI